MTIRKEAKTFRRIFNLDSVASDAGLKPRQRACCHLKQLVINALRLGVCGSTYFSVNMHCFCTDLQFATAIG